ncbi:hypothetical protein [Edaphobacillus lindanitolerans]|uniref:Uncharacterized protein n=1 Tax=Edaphobacillus lindanitolerans TaxID=550447 RepID=A0A1U7PS57_9BACI|nr:hypothetical protein [Edaphobacillus lindanitolerans]SIT88670.1 hypothetical protein SAMN05428946_2310 [Edaphobacillus lindanitolerans]
MLNFAEKEAIIGKFPELTRKEVSMGRVNYHFDESLHEKKIVVRHLHENGNGFVYVGKLPEYEADKKGFINIREFSAEELEQVIADAIAYLSTDPAGEPVNETWKNREGTVLHLKEENGYFNLYYGDNLEEGFGSAKEAHVYLLDEGFRPQGGGNR